MFDFNGRTAGSSILAAVAAFIFTTVSVGAAVGPAEQLETSPLLAAAPVAPVQANG